MALTTTLGKMMVNRAIPEDMQDNERIFDKKQSEEFFLELAEKHPDDYIRVLRKLSDISSVAATEHGGIASLRLKDLRLPPRTRAYRKELEQKIHAISQDPSLKSEVKNDRIVKLMRRAMPTIQKTLEKEVFARENAYGESIKHGFKGSPVQLTQLLFGDMLVADHKGRAVPIPGLHGYGEGVLPSEYWAGAYGARKGYADVQFATAKTGFLGKQLAGMAQHIRITGEDCGAEDLGILFDGDDAEIIGSVLARAVGDIPIGSVITKAHLPKLKGKKPLVRSLLTCQQPEGVCQKCAGKRDQGRFPAIGAYIGIDAARVVAEPMVQELALSAKHTGGVIGVNSDNISGFDEINQFVQIPKVFRGAAMLAPVEGKVRQIVKAPQGGHYMHIGQEQVYISPQQKITVRVGQGVEAGDVLTDGTPNPAEIAKYKGLGAGRIYFLEKYYEILKNNGVPTHRRNVEVLARSFFDRVKVTNPDGLLGYRIGDIIPYGELQKDYKPRSDSSEVHPKRSVGMYLEKPVLHYTLGTRITPNIAKFLDTEKITSVTVHREGPGFEPAVTRIMGIAGEDPDWKVRMSGFGVKKSFLESARMGAESKRKGTSYVPKLMNPSLL